MQIECFGDRLMPGMMDALDANEIHLWLPDLVPGLQCAGRIVLHEEAGAKQIEGVCIIGLERQRRARQR